MFLWVTRGLVRSTAVGQAPEGATGLRTRVACLVLCRSTGGYGIPDDDMDNLGDKGRMEG